MQITVIIIFSIYCLIVLAGFIFTHFNKVDKSQYEIATGSNKGYLIFGWVFFAIGSLMDLAGLILIFVFANQEMIMLLPSVGSLFGLLGYLLIFILSNQFEAIKGNIVYIRRFKKIKEVNIKDIFSFDFMPRLGFVALDKYGNKLFSMDIKSNKGLELVNLINERKAGRIYSNINELDMPNDNEETISNETLVKIGKEYRDSYPIRRKKRLVYFITFFSLIIIAVLSFFLYLLLKKDSRAILVLFMVVLFVVMFIIITNRSLTYLKKELDRDDEWLGAKYKIFNKNVKGYHKNKAKNITLILISPIILGLLSALILPISYNQKIYKQDELVEVSGKLDYFYQINNGDYVLGIVDDPIEYRLDDMYLDYLDKTTFDEIHKNDNVLCLVDTDKPLSQNMKHTDKKEYKFIYTIKINEKEYLSYNNYFSCEKNNQRIGIIVGYVLLSIGLSSLLSLLVVNTTYAKSTKDEYIEV